MNTPSLPGNQWILLGVLAIECAVIVLLATLARGRVKSGAGQRTVWQVAMLALVAALAIEWSGAGRSVAGWVRQRTADSRPPVANVEPRTVPFVPAPVDVVPLNLSKSTRDMVEPDQPLPLVAPPKTAPPANRANRWAGVIWLLGFGILAGRIGLRRLAFASCCREHREHGDLQLTERTQALARALGFSQSVRLLESAECLGPIAFGLGRPTIALPPRFTANFSAAQQDAMLAHELAHLAARDPAWHLLADLVSAALWWHPLVWAARRRLQTASELAADEASRIVTDGPAALAESLVKLGAQMTEQKSTGGLGVEGKGFRSGLGQRVERLLQMEGQPWRAPHRLKSLLAKTVGPVALALAAVLCGGWAWPQALLDRETPFTQLRHSWQGLLAAMSPTAKAIEQGERPRQLVVRIGDQMIALPYQTVPPPAQPKGRAGRRPIDPQKAPDAPPNDPPPPLLYPTLPPKIVPGAQANLKEGGTNSTVPLPPLLYPTKPPRLVAEAQSKPGPADKGGLGASQNSAETRASLVKRIDALKRLVYEARKKYLEHPDEQIKAEGDRFQKDLDALQKRALQVDAEMGRLPFRHSKPLSVQNAHDPVPATSTKARQMLMAKMDQIQIEELSFDNVPLTEVVKLLTDECRKQDPEKKGVNFIINPHLELSQSDPSGHPYQVTFDLENRLISIKPPIHDISLCYALDAVCRAADQPIQFIVEDYAVVFMPKQNRANQMFVRTYKVDPNTFMQGLQSVTGVPLPSPSPNSQGNRASSNPTIPRVQTAPTGQSRGGIFAVTGTNNTSVISGMVRRYFQAAGVNLGTNINDEAATRFFFNDRTGVLAACGPIHDLEIIEQAITLANQAPLQVAQASETKIGGASTARTAPPNTSTEARQELLAKLDQIQIAELSFDGVPLTEVVKFLADECRKQAPGMKGLNFIIDPHVELSELDPFSLPLLGRLDLGNTRIRINPPQRHLTLRQALDVICHKANLPMHFKVTDYGIILAPRLVFSNRRQLDKPEATSRSVPTGSPQANPNAGQSNEVGKRWLLPGERDDQPSRNPYYATPYVRTNVPNTSTKARQMLMAKMDQIQIEELSFDNVPLTEVVKFLADECRKQDPKKKGLNFIINPYLESAPTASQFAPGTNSPSPPRKTDLENVLIKISPPLHDLTLHQALDVICKMANQPIQFIVEDYAIVFTPKPTTTPQMFTRSYKVDPNTFQQGLQGVTGVPLTGPSQNGQNGRGSTGPIIPRVNIAPTGPSGGGVGSVTHPNTSQAAHEALRQSLATLGLKAGTNAPSAGAPQVLFNDRTGMLVVRATLADLETIEHAIGAINRPVQQIALEVHYAETTREGAVKFGFAQFLGTAPASSNRQEDTYLWATNRSTVPTNATNSPSKPATAGPSPGSVKPGKGMGATAGILKPADFKLVMQALERDTDVKLQRFSRMNAVNGGKAQVQAVELKSVVTAVKRDASGVNYQTQTLPFGPVLDIVPSVGADGFSVQMSLMATVTEFLGYVDPRSEIPKQALKTLEGQDPKLVVPLPKMRSRQTTTSAVVWDGQTVLLAVPSGSTATDQKALFFFITPTLIDPAGNRLHTDEELSKRQSASPPQPGKNRRSEPLPSPGNNNPPRP